ncbi:MAG: hypothetical protein WDM87_02375 [Terracidiphilus sp.]
MQNRLLREKEPRLWPGFLLRAVPCTAFAGRHLALLHAPGSQSGKTNADGGAADLWCASSPILGLPERGAACRRAV